MKNKIKASVDGDRIKVNAKFYRKNKKVHEINHAFPLNTSAEEIKEEVKKAGEVFLKEEKQKKIQVKIDEEQDKAQEVINKLNK